MLPDLFYIPPGAMYALRNKSANHDGDFALFSAETNMYFSYNTSLHGFRMLGDNEFVEDVRALYDIRNEWGLSLETKAKVVLLTEWDAWFSYSDVQEPDASHYDATGALKVARG